MKNLKIPVAFTVKFLLFSLLFPAELVFSFTFTKVKLHEAATLPCYQRCSGLVTWAHKDDILAQCDQTSCQSGHQGFQMSHDQYLKGNLSLTITKADFSKRMWYTCRCDGKAVCDVSLRIEPFSYPVHVQAGQPLTLDLPIPDDVEVTFNRTDDAGSNSFRLCTIEGQKAQCDSLYQKRVSVGSSLRLNEVKNGDGGIYILHDIKNQEVIGMYTVTVSGTHPESSDGLPAKETPPSQDGFVATLVAVGLGALLAVAVLVIVVLLVKNQRLRKCLRRMENVPISMQQVEREVERQEKMEDEPEVTVHSPVMETDDGQRIIEQKKLQSDSENDSDTAEDEIDPLLETDSPVNPASVTDEPPLSLPVPDSCSEYLADTQTRVFE